MSGESGGHRLRLSMLNDQLTCKLCHGYFIDATTIIECLHSFCRSCIVKYLENNKYCPICEVQVHKSKPLLNIRPDHTLQDIVYKLVPACYQNEMRCRRDFYAKNPEALRSTTSPEARGEPVESHIYSPDESLSLSLEYYNPIDQPIIGELGVDDAKETSGGRNQHQQQDQKDQRQQKPRYLRCPAAVMVFHLQKLIRAKYGLSEAHRVDVMYKEETLCDTYTLMDVMYIYHWRRKVPLHLSYRIFESSPKRLKLSEDNENFKQSLTNVGIRPIDPRNDSQTQQQFQQQQQQQGIPGTKREWKEVQLKISETGVMSVTDITSPDSKKNSKTDKKSSNNSTSIPSISGNTTKNDSQKRLDDDSTPNLVNKNDKTRQDAKTSSTIPELTKNRDKKSFDSGKNVKNESLKKISEQSTTTTISATTTTTTTTTTATTTTTTNIPKSIAGTSEIFSSNSREISSSQSRESNNNERTTMTRETRSRSDLRSSNSQENEQTSLKNNSTTSESKKTKSSIVETSIVNEKTLKKSHDATIDDEKLLNRLQSTSINDKIVDSKDFVQTAVCSHEDNKKSIKIQDTKNQQNSTTGSKIDALSVKLQFQPKSDEPNTAVYPKKSLKEKKTILEKVLKKSSPSSSTSSLSTETGSMTVKQIGKNTSESPKTRSSTSTINKTIRVESNPISISTSIVNQTSQIINCLGGATTITSSHQTTPTTPTTSVTVSVTTTMQKSIDRTEISTSNRRLSSSSVENSSTTTTTASTTSTTISTTSTTIPATTTTTTTTTSTPITTEQNTIDPKSTSKNSYRRENQIVTAPSSESLASIGLNVSTSIHQTSTTTFPYTVQDLVNSGILKNSSSSSKLSGLTIQKTSSNNSTTSSSLNQSSSTSGPSFNLHTPSMTIYSISTPAKNNTTSNLVSASLYSNSTPQMTNSSPTNVKNLSNTLIGKTNNSSNIEITNVYSVPPCPDAIPISLMKPTVRKHEVIAKATNVNDICAKIGNSTVGSKINDICAKIGENTKEKNKIEARSRPEIPDLLKIAKKPLQTLTTPCTVDMTSKHIPNIPNIPIYTPTNSLNVETKSYANKETKHSSIASSTTQSSLQLTKNIVTGVTTKKQSQSMGYTTLRHPPKSWNPTLSKNNYVAMKNQAKESLQSSQQQTSGLLIQQQQQEIVNNPKTTVTKRPDSAKRRNTPRFLGNPASGVKPLYGVTEGKLTTSDCPETSTTIVNPVGQKNSGLSMKIDPKTLSPIVSSNSPIVSPPPYSPGARGTCYQTFSRDLCGRTSTTGSTSGSAVIGGGSNTGSTINSRNSPVNMLSTNPFIPSPTPNTHPRLFYPHYPPPFPETTRLSNPLIRTPIGIPPPSAYHSSLPPSINKFLQRTSYMPQNTGVYSQQTISQPPTVQRIPASSSSSISSSPKSPKKSLSPGINFSTTKNETQISLPTISVNSDTKNLSLIGKINQDSNAFNLSKTGSSQSMINVGNVERITEIAEKEIGKGIFGKRENLGKNKQESDNKRKISIDNERGRKDDDDGKTTSTGCKKSSTDDREKSLSHKNTDKEKTIEENRDGDFVKKDMEKCGNKINGDLNVDNNSSSDVKTQDGHTRNDLKDCGKTNLTKEIEMGKQISTPQGNNNSGGEKNSSSKDCNEKKVDEQIGKSGETIQGKNNKTTNVECQRNKAES